MGKTILTDTQSTVLSLLSKQPGFDQFYFTGGTALAEYYLHHRLSEDLDFFTENEVSESWLVVLAKKIKKSIAATEVDIQQSFNRNLVFFTTKDGILKTEFTYFPFPRFKRTKANPEISIDSIEDIAINKFFTIYQKPSARHFIDLYLILQKYSITWQDLFKKARIKFDTHIDPVQLGSQLMLVQDVQDLPIMLIPLNDSVWRNYFLDRARELASRISTE